MMWDDEMHLNWCRLIAEKQEWIKLNASGDGINIRFLMKTIDDLKSKRAEQVLEKASELVAGYKEHIAELAGKVVNAEAKLEQVTQERNDWAKASAINLETIANRQQEVNRLREIVCELPEPQTKRTTHELEGPTGDDLSWYEDKPVDPDYGDYYSREDIQQIREKWKK